MTGGVTAAIEAATAAAAEKRVHIMGGASIIQQALWAGMVDRLRLHIAPLILGSGTALFDGGNGPQLDLRSTTATPEASHLKYEVRR
jgi:dihydrofolate reductase